MNRRIVLCSPSFDFISHQFTIGGIQTYIRDLAIVCNNAGIETILVCMRDDYNERKETIYEGTRIIQQKSVYILGRYSAQRTFNNIYSEYNSDNTLFVIDTDQRDIKSTNHNVITIQHGIAFDIPGDLIEGFWGRTNSLQNINKLLRCIKNARRLSYTPNTICVDYNYFNWCRTITTVRGNVKVIPNYSSDHLSYKEVLEKISTLSRPYNIVFARRFVSYRGMIIFKNVVLRLFKEGYNFYVTFAGSGPLYDDVFQEFKDNDKVNFTSFDSRDSITFHKSFDIAVVPTIFSEGTSLSLCEAMSSGCIPVATHVGGMTNMILDGYNGFLCYPSEEHLYRCLKSVLDMEISDMSVVAARAYDTAVQSFSKDKWAKNWLSYLDILYKKNK